MAFKGIKHGNKIDNDDYEHRHRKRRKPLPRFYDREKKNRSKEGKEKGMEEREETRKKGR